MGLVSRWPVRGTVVRRRPAVRHGRPTAITATLGHPSGPLHVVVACTEWEREPQALADHLAQTTALASIRADPALDGDLPVLLAGDLNADVGSEQLAPLLAVATDLWVAGGGDPGAVTLPRAHAARTSPVTARWTACTLEPRRRRRRRPAAGRRRRRRLLTRQGG